MLRINYSKLSTKVLGNFSNRSLALIVAQKATLLKDNPLCETLSKRNEEFQEVVIKKIYSGLGDPVASADMTRDKLFRGLRRMLQGLAAFAETSKGQAAAALLHAFDEAGSIDNLSYADQNTVVQKLIKLLDEEKNQMHLTLLALTDEYAAMKASQAAFEKIQDEQTGANSALRQQASASGIRKELEDALRNILSMVSAMKNVPGWTSLYHDLNELIKEARQSNHQSKKTGEENTTPV